MTTRAGIISIALLLAAVSAAASAGEVIRVVEHADTDAVTDTGAKGDSVLAITGGTGKYAAARGQMKLHARDSKGTAYDFVYELQ
jgi:hypothetical protein